MKDKRLLLPVLLLIASMIACAAPSGISNQTLPSFNNPAADPNQDGSGAPAPVLPVVPSIEAESQQQMQVAIYQNVSPGVVCHPSGFRSIWFTGIRVCV